MLNSTTLFSGGPRFHVMLFLFVRVSAAGRDLREQCCERTLFSVVVALVNAVKHSCFCHKQRFGWRGKGELFLHVFVSDNRGHVYFRQRTEERVNELSGALDSTQKAYQSEISGLKLKTREQRERIEQLNHQVCTHTSHTHTHTHNQSEISGLKLKTREQRERIEQLNHQVCTHTSNTHTHTHTLSE